MPWGHTNFTFSVTLPCSLLALALAQSWKMSQVLKYIWVKTLAVSGKTRLCYFSSWPCQFFASLRTKYASNTYASKFSTITSPVSFKQISICIVLLAEQFWHIACTSSRLAFVVFLSTNFCLLIISFLTKM